MKKRISGFLLPVLLLNVGIFLDSDAMSQESAKQRDIEKKVQAFLKSSEGTWRDMNVPVSDGQLLHDIIVKHKYKKALEIGTSTGHSGVWIAWALSKTGGKLITIDIDERRHRKALENFKKAGVSEFVDARLADAHELVKELKGPFDFVFSDADKEWYKNYFVDLEPKLEVGGCFTAHNISMNSPGIQEFVKYVQGLSNYETKIDESSRAGVSISYKKSKK